MKFVLLLLREPLLQFFIAGIVVFSLYEASGASQQDDHTEIYVSEHQIKQLAALWQKVHAHAPSAS